MIKHFINGTRCLSIGTDQDNGQFRITVTQGNIGNEADEVSVLVFKDRDEFDRERERQYEDAVRRGYAADPDRISKEWSEGWKHICDHRPDMAMGCANVLIERYPGSAGGWDLAGVSYIQMAEKLHDSGQDYIRREMLDLYEQAIAYLRKAADADPAYDGPWFNLAKIYETVIVSENGTTGIQMDRNKALECRRRALELRKDDTNCVKLLNLLEDDEFIKTAEEWMEREPDNPCPLIMLSDMYYRSGDSKRGWDHYERYMYLAMKSKRHHLDMCDDLFR
jgi:tetratricopeptide (TPR) repeat protein